MVNPYLDWIWSKYANTPEQGMLSLRETCSALLKYTLVPSDMILSGGGYILHHNLATPLSNVVCAMDYLLDLSAKHVGFVKIPTIGYTELNILSGTGIQHGLATQSQIVASWVSILDHICAAKYQLKALCSGDTTHSSLHAWVSQVDTFASSLPLELRKKLPTDLVERFGMEAEERSPPTAPGSKIHSPPASTAMSSSSTFSPRIPSNLLSAPSLFTLVPDGKIYAADTSLESIWIHELGKGRCVLNKELLYFVMDTVRRMQAILTQTFTPLRGQTGCFQIDPNGELEQTLHSANTLESLDSAWGTLVQRMREANACFKEYQQRYQQVAACRRTETSSIYDAREDRAPFPSSTSASAAFVSSGGMVEHGGQKNQQHNSTDASNPRNKNSLPSGRQVTQASSPSFSSSRFPSPAPCSALSECTVELGGRKHRQRIGGREQIELTARFQTPPPAPLPPSAACSAEVRKGAADVGGRTSLPCVACTSTAESGGQDVATTHTNISTNFVEWKTRTVNVQVSDTSVDDKTKRRRSPSAVDDSYVESLLAAHGRQGEHKMLKKGEDLPAEFIETQNNSLLTETPCRSLTVPSGIDGNGRAFKYSWSRSPSPSSGIAELQTSLLSTSSPAHPLHLEENGCLQIESNQLRSRATQKCRDAPIALIDESIPTAPPPASSFPTPDAARVAENSKLQTSATENASLDHLVLPTVNSLVDAAAEGEPTGLSSYSLGLRSAFVAANTTSSLVIRDNESRRELQDNDKQSVELRTTPIEGRRKKTRLKKEEQALAELEQEVKSSLLTDRLSSSLAAPPNIDEVTYKPLRMDGVDERRAPNLAVGYTGRMTEVSSSKYWVRANASIAEDGKLPLSTSQATLELLDGQYQPQSKQMSGHERTTNITFSDVHPSGSVDTSSSKSQPPTFTIANTVKVVGLARTRSAAARVAATHNDSLVRRNGNGALTLVISSFFSLDLVTANSSALAVPALMENSTFALPSATVRTKRSADLARNRREDGAPCLLWYREGIGTCVMA